MWVNVMKNIIALWFVQMSTYIDLISLFDLYLRAVNENFWTVSQWPEKKYSEVDSWQNIRNFILWAEGKHGTCTIK